MPIDLRTDVPIRCLDLHDTSIFNTGGDRAADIATNGLKLGRLKFMKNNDKCREERVHDILDKIRHNQKILAESMEWNTPKDVEWYGKTYRLNDGVPSFLHFTKQEIGVVHRFLDHRPSSEIKLINAAPSISSVIVHRRDPMSSVEENRSNLRRSARLSRN